MPNTGLPRRSLLKDRPRETVNSSGAISHVPGRCPGRPLLPAPRPGPGASSAIFLFPLFPAALTSSPLSAISQVTCSPNPSIYSLVPWVKSCDSTNSTGKQNSFPECQFLEPGRARGGKQVGEPPRAGYRLSRTHHCVNPRPTQPGS